MRKSGGMLCRLLLGLWLMMGLAAYGQNLAPEANAGQWLNVRDCGASGSEYDTTASTTEGSQEILVADVGDFQAGQGVMVSSCNIHYTNRRIWGPVRAQAKPLEEDVMEMRGYDGSAGSWTVYVLEVEPGKPATVRWTDDLARTWHEKTPITGDWQPLSGGTEVRFHKLEWGEGYAITFSARDQLVSVIEKIEGTTLTLKDAANRTVQDAVVRHNDTVPLQSAIDQAIKEKRDLYFPIGRYRLSQGLVVRDPTAIRIEGASAVGTIIDMTEGEGTCFRFVNGEEVTMRNLRLIGHSGFAYRDQCGYLRLNTITSLWGFYLKQCNAVSISNTERVLIENCHATKMASECFYSQGRARKVDSEPEQYTKSITYLRCSVEDSGRNAFNNNDLAENTSVLYCRIRDVGGCSWEGASRFVRFIGNYVRNGGTVAMGNIRSRGEYLEQLGTGQHIIADNVFETGVCYGSCAVRLGSGGTQTIIRNNLFINYGTSAIEVQGPPPVNSLPSRYATVTGNILDMTNVEAEGKSRWGIAVSASDVIVSDNQIYVRGECDPQVTAIKLTEPLVNLDVHGNQISNCGSGIAASRGYSRVAEVVDATTFVSGAGTVSLERRQSHRYRGWGMVWVIGGRPSGISMIDSFDPDTLQYKLREPREMTVGDVFEVFPNLGANWDIHDNTVTGCLNPVVLDSYGSETSRFRDNTISRGEVTGVEQAVQVRGWFRLIGNQISGFDEAGCSALALYPDRAGRAVRNLYLRNIFERCANPVAETAQGLWSGAQVGDNLFQECGTRPEG